MQFTLFYNKAGCVELSRAAAIHSFKRTGLEEKKGVKSKMAKDKMYGKTLRKNFARHEEIVEMPNLLALQKKSYQWFLDTGLREVFSDVASISNYAGNLELSFIDYKMDEAPKYDVLECKARDATYAAPLKVSVRLYNKETGEIKEQEIFMGDFPLMTESGTFVINGAERVVVSQLVRSPGIYYGKEIDLKTDLPLLTSTVIPYRGAWLEYETDANEMFWVRIDKNRKIPITELVRAIGFKTDAEILELFGDDDRVAVTLEKDACKTYEEAMLEIYRKLRPGEPPTVEACETLINNLFFDPRRYDLSMVGRYKYNKKLSLWARIRGQKLSFPVADPRTGEILFDAGHIVTDEEAREMDAIGVMFKINGTVVTPALTGSILRGVTRKSAIELLKSWGVPVEERLLSVDELFDAAASGALEEAWCIGTAAVISPIGELSWGDRDYKVNDNKIGALSQKLYDELTGIQWGTKPDPFGWVCPID